jgi:hypothetical protein
MAPKHHPSPLSGGDRKALQKELGKARAMTTILATQSAEARAAFPSPVLTAGNATAVGGAPPNTLIFPSDFGIGEPQFIFGEPVLRTWGILRASSLNRRN